VLSLKQERKVAAQSATHNAEYCLERAIECYEKALEFPDAYNRAMLRDLAKWWRTLARLSKDRGSFNPIATIEACASPNSHIA
jgi:hypothetical protein